MANVNKTIKHQRFKINYTQNEKIEQVTDLTMVVGVDIGSIMQELLTTEESSLKEDIFFVYRHQNEPKFPRSGKLREALTYALNPKRLFTDGDVPKDNNASECVIRGFCIGKKNWQMIAILRGASNSAIIYSLGLRNCLHTLESNDKNSIVTVKVV